MRTIKFRGWNRRTNKMIDVQKLTPFATELKGLFLPTEDDHVELMQFTGLLDKNGKEIYEGDVVRSEGYTGKVFYWNGKKITSSPGFFVAVDDDEDEIITLDQRYEVIGNIYENPELLTKN